MADQREACPACGGPGPHFDISSCVHHLAQQRKEPMTDAEAPVDIPKLYTWNGGNGDGWLATEEDLRAAGWVRAKELEEVTENLKAADDMVEHLQHVVSEANTKTTAAEAALEEANRKLRVAVEDCEHVCRVRDELDQELASKLNNIQQLTGELNKLADGWTEHACLIRSDGDGLAWTHAAEKLEECADDLRAAFRSHQQPAAPQPVKLYRVTSQRDRLYGRIGAFKKREGALVWLYFENELAPVAFYCKALEPAPEPTAGTRIGTCVGCKTPRCALDDDPYCCKLCRNRNAPASSATGGGATLSVTSDGGVSLRLGNTTSVVRSAGDQQHEADHLSEAEHHICDVIIYSPKDDPLWIAVRGALRELSLDAEQRRAKENR